MKTLNRIIVILILCFAFFSCEQESLTPTKEPYKDLNEFFEKNGAPIQIFSISANTGGTIVGTKGTTIAFSPFSFKHANGSLVTGAVTISLREVYSKADMVLSKVSTTCNGAPLKSGGMFELHAWQGNEELQMANGMNYTATMPATNPDGNMRAFLGMGTTDTADINWVLADTAQVLDTTVNGQNNYYGNLFTEAIDYVWNSNWLGWCNSDAPYFNAVNDVIHFTTNNKVSVYSTQVSLVFTSNTMIHVYNTTDGQFDYAYAPNGYDATLVAVGLEDSILYSAFVPFTISANQWLDFTMRQTTSDEFKAALDTLH